jgi:hypothetical protein
MKINLLLIIINLLLSPIYLYSQINSEIIGNWGMFKDKHPDGWGSFNPPYEYIEFKVNGEYIRTFIQRKHGPVIMFGTYEIIGDTLIVFNEGIGFDGSNIGNVKSRFSKLFNIKEEILELHEDWYSLFRKKLRQYRHKKKFRRLTTEEQEILNSETSYLLKLYLVILNSETNNSDASR